MRRLRRCLRLSAKLRVTDGQCDSTGTAFIWVFWRYDGGFQKGRGIDKTRRAGSCFTRSDAALKPAVLGQALVIPDAAKRIRDDAVVSV
jgi:hypothetical protein